LKYYIVIKLILIDRYFYILVSYYTSSGNMIPNSLFEQTSITNMMALLESDRIKKDIMKLLYENGEMTFGRLRTKTGSGFRTIKNNSEFLQDIGFVVIEKKSVGDRKRELAFVKLTSFGKEYQEKRTISKDEIPYDI